MPYGNTVKKSNVNNVLCYDGPVAPFDPHMGKKIKISLS
jgi:hypothetical protein